MIKRTELQNKFVSAFIEYGGNMIAEVATGFGKTFLAYSCLLKLLELEWITEDSTIFIFAETNDRKNVFKEEALKYKGIFKVNPLTLFKNIHFKTYQSKVTEHRSVDIYDEMKFGLTAKYHKSLLYPAKYKLGLDAMIPKNLYVFQDLVKDMNLHEAFQQSSADTKAGKITDFIKKGQLAEIIIPNKVTYTLEQGIEDGVLSPYETVVINHSLGTKHKYLVVRKDRKKKTPIYGSEKEWYEFKNSLRNWDGLNYRYKVLLGKQIIPNFLYTLKSKAIVTNKLLSLYPDRKFLIFGVRKDLLYDITPNVCEPKTTENLVQAFNSNKINTIASVKMIQQGKTLKGITDIVIVSYYKSSADFLQRLGRLVRFEEGKVGRIWVIKTLNTFEDDYTKDSTTIDGWFSKMQQVYNSQGELVDTVDLRIKSTINSIDLFNPNFKL